MSTDQTRSKQNPEGNEELTETLDPEQRKLLGTFLTTLSNKALEMETQRGDGLERLAGHLLTCITILSAVYLTPASSLFSFCSAVYPAQSPSPAMLAWLYFFTLASLFVALLITLSSLYKRKVKVFSSPNLQKNYVAGIKQQLEEDSCKEPFDSYTMASAYSEALEDHYVGIHAKNDLMWSRLKTAMALIMFSVSVALVGGFLLFVKFA